VGFRERVWGRGASVQIDIANNFSNLNCYSQTYIFTVTRT